MACKKYVKIKTLQRFQGKCISFLLAVPAAKLFIRVKSSATVHASASGQVGFSPCLREDLSYWRFLDSWEGCVPWRDEKHVGLSLATDASGYGRGCVLHLSSGDQEFRDNLKSIGNKCPGDELMVSKYSYKRQTRAPHCALYSSPRQRTVGAHPPSL